jgi:hypothetical protein
MTGAALVTTAGSANAYLRRWNAAKRVEAPAPPLALTPDA